MNRHVFSEIASMHHTWLERAGSYLHLVTPSTASLDQVVQHVAYSKGLVHGAWHSGSIRSYDQLGAEGATP